MEPGPIRVAHLNGHANENAMIEAEEAGENYEDDEFEDYEEEQEGAGDEGDAGGAEDIVEIPAVPAWMRELEAEETIMHLKQAIKYFSQSPDISSGADSRQKFC